MTDLSPEERCETTGNLCGTDTWQKDKGCRCWPCTRARVFIERERCVQIVLLWVFGERGEFVAKEIRKDPLGP